MNKQKKMKYLLFGVGSHLCILFVIFRRGLALNLKAAKAIIERKFDMYENNAFFKFTLFLIKVA